MIQEPRSGLHGKVRVGQQCAAQSPGGSVDVGHSKLQVRHCLGGGVYVELPQTIPGCAMILSGADGLV